MSEENEILLLKQIETLFRSKAKKSTSGWFNWFGGSAGKDPEQLAAAAATADTADNNNSPVKE